MTSTVTPEWRLQDRLGRALDAGEVSVQQMADVLGVSRNTVGNYLHGRTTPNLSVLRVWALRCGVPLAWLLTGEEGDTATVTLWYATDGVSFATDRDINSAAA